MASSRVARQRRRLVVLAATQHLDGWVATGAGEELAAAIGILQGAQNG